MQTCSHTPPHRSKGHTIYLWYRWCSVCTLLWILILCDVCFMIIPIRHMTLDWRSCLVTQIANGRSKVENCPLPKNMCAWCCLPIAFMLANILTFFTSASFFVKEQTRQIPACPFQSKVSLKRSVIPFSHSFSCEARKKSEKGRVGPIYNILCRNVLWKWGGSFNCP